MFSQFKHAHAALPISIASGSGLGVAPTLHTQTDILPPARTMGAAQVACHHNAANGNLVVHDHTLRFTAVDRVIEVAYIYNTKAQTPWRLAHGRSLSSIQPQQNITVTEADGHEVVYHYDALTKTYQANECPQGKSILRMDTEQQKWTLTHPDTGVIETFNNDGQLAESQDAHGRTTHYAYKAGRLSAISAQGLQLNIEYTDNRLNVLHGDNLLHTYEFNNGLLQKSITADGYTVEYQYNDKQLLKQIQQTDQTVLGFGYDDDKKLKTLDVGHEQALTIDYTAQATTFTTASGASSVVTYDQQQNLSAVTDAAGNTTSISINAAQQLQTVTYPDQSCESFQYDEQTGVIKQHVQRNGAVITYQYETVGQRTVLTGMQEFTSVDAVMPARQTQFIYDFSGAVPRLRYEISPMGAVIEYVRDATNGLILAKREYVADRFVRADNTPIDLAVLNTWAQDKRHATTLTTYTYNEQERIQSVTHYAAVDAEGHGVLNDDASITEFEYNAAGMVTVERVSANGVCLQQHASTYDLLQRELQKVVGVESGSTQVTRTTYQADTITTQLPNGRSETIKTAADGLSSTETVAVPTSETTRTLSTEVRARQRKTIITKPDQSKHIQFHDAADRLQASVSASGCVTTYTYHAQSRCRVETMHADTIDINSLADNACWDDLAQHLKLDANQDRTSYTFDHVNGKPQYEIDALGYLTAYQYDSFGQLIQKITYANAVTQDELSSLLTGGILARQPDRSKDNVKTFFYDADGHQIGEQDADGYVTEFVYDAGGRLIEKINYAQPNKAIGTGFAAIRPVLSTHDAHHYYYYNARNLCVLEVDAEHGLHTHEYCADGKRAKTTHLYNQLPKVLVWDKRSAPDISAYKSQYDQTVEFEYDALRRLTHEHHSNGKTIERSYDEMNHVRDQSIYDRQHRQLNGDGYRAETDEYDAWEQCTRHFNPFVKLKIAQVQADAKLSVAERNAEIEMIMSKAAERAEYDATGLKIKTTDALGHVTLYYYDAERRPVLVINPLGAVIQQTYNAFGEVTKEHHYYQMIPAEMLSTLAGGALTSEVEALLKPHAKDAEVTYDRDRRGQVKRLIDAEKNETTYEYDALRRCHTETLPVNSTQASLCIQRQFDGRGHVVTETKTAAGQASITSSKKYDHYLGLETESTDPVGAVERIKRDKLGREESIAQKTENGRFAVLKKFMRDAFGRPHTIVDANNKQTFIKYSVDGLTQITTHPEKGITTETKTNIFGEVVSTQQGAAPVTTIQHAPNGAAEVIAHGDAKTITTFDLMGQEASVTDPEGVISVTERNAANQIIRHIEDVGGLNHTTEYQRNAFGEAECVIDPEGMVTQNEFDRRSQLRSVTIDPGTQEAPGLALKTSLSVNAQGQVSGMVKGDTATPNLYTEKTEIDGFNRVIAKVVDPEGLKRRTAYELDAAGQVRCETDANQNKKYYFYNIQRQQRFALVGHGDPAEQPRRVKATEMLYTPTGKLRSVRRYAVPLNENTISTQTSLDQLKSLCQKNPNDGLTLFFYDANDREKYKVKVFFDYVANRYRAVVKEKLFNNADQEIKTTKYAHYINIDDIEKLTTADIDKAVAALNPSAPHRVVYHGYDANGREVLTVHGDGSIIEKQYDRRGRCLTEIEYQRKHPNPELLAGVCNADVLATLEPFKEQARYQHHVYDRAGNEIFTVAANGLVTQKTFDKKKTLTSTCLFKTPVDPAVAHADLRKTLFNLKQDPARDAITVNHHDRAGRLERVVDPLGHQDRFKLDACGNVTEHTDRNGHTSKIKYNGANEVEDEISPHTTISSVSTQNDGQLTTSDHQVEVVKKTKRDGVGNAQTVIDGHEIDKSTEGATKPRTAECRYDAEHRLVALTAKSVSVSVIYPATNLPMNRAEPKDVTQLIRYNTQGKKIAERDQNGYWDYYLYDSMGRLAFKIVKGDALIRLTRNALGQVTEEYQYATPITLTHDELISEQNHAALLTQLHGHKETEKDRYKRTEYYADGKVKMVTTTPIPCFANDKFTITPPTKMYEYNTFGQVICEKTLIAPDDWAIKYTWYDAAGRPEYEVNDQNYVTYYKRDAQGNILTRIEYNKPIDGPVTAGMALDLLTKQIDQEDKKNRVYVMEYDARGDLLSETLMGMEVYKTAIQADTKPYLEKMNNQSVTKRYEYTPTRKIKKTIHEDNTFEEKFYDERDLPVAETDVIRQAFQEDDLQVIGAPLRRNKVDAFGDVVEKQFSHSQVASKGAGIPTFTGVGEIHKEITLRDERGLPSLLQDALGHQVKQTFTASKKLASQYHFITYAKKPNEKPRDPQAYELGKREDFTVYLMTKTDKVSDVVKMFDGRTVSHHVIARNIFDEVVREGQKSEMAVLHKLDHSGRAWFTNADNGVNTIKLRNLLGHETKRIQASDLDLLQIEMNAEAIQKLLQMDPAQVDFHAFTRDHSGNLLEHRAPIWYRDRPQRPTWAFKHDRWHNQTSKTDHMGHETLTEYEHRNHPIKITEPEVEVVVAGQPVVKMRPETSYYYSLRGINVGTRDANGNLTVNILDEASQALATVLPDGTKVDRRDLDFGGRERFVYDSANNQTAFKRTPYGDVVRLTNPAISSMCYLVNEIGQRIVTIDPEMRVTIEDFDSAGNVNLTVMPLGQKTFREFDHEHEMLTITHPDQTSQTWERTPFGVPTRHVDLAGRDTIYDNNFKNQVRKQTTSGGPARYYSQLSYGKVPLFDVNNPVGCYLREDQNNAPTQTIFNEYQFGLLQQTIDHGKKRLYRYGYHNGGLRNELEIKDLENNMTLRRIKSEQDALMRDQKIIDEFMILNGQRAAVTTDFGFSATNDVTHMRMTLIPPRYSDACQVPEQVTDLWNTFDACQRILISGGEFNGNQVLEPAPIFGAEFEYQNNRRSAETVKASNNEKFRSTLSYHATGGVEEVKNEQLIATWEYAGMGYAWAKKIDYRRDFIKYTSNFDENYATQTTRVFDSVAANHLHDGEYMWSQSTYVNDESGRPRSMVNFVNVKDASQVDIVRMDYFNADSPILQAVRSNRTNRYGSCGYALADFWIDQNGNHLFKFHSDDEPYSEMGGDGEGKFTYFDTTTQGTILSKQFMYTEGNLPDGRTKVLPVRVDQMLLTPNGKTFGMIRSAYLLSDHQRDQAAHSSSSSSSCTLPVTSRPSPFMFHKPISLLAEDVKVEVNDPMKSGYHREDIPIGVVPYFINKGDTFESICDSIYGDASLARDLQIRTGLLASKALAPGQLIYLPKLIPTHHKPGMMRPYHELRGLLTGRLLPHLTTPLPKAHHTSFLGNLAKIIAVALIIAFAPALAGLLFSVTGLSAAVVAAGLAAIGDAAVQGVAIGVGIQEKFSFNEVIETAASAAAVTVVGPMTKNATHLVASAEKALSVATAQVSSQLTEMELNLRDKFNARDVVSQVAASIIGDEISTYADNNVGTSTAAKATTKIVSSVASSAAGTRVTHTPFNIQNAVSNAVGNATGSSVSEHVQSRITSSHDQNTTHHRTAPAHTSADRQATTHRPAKNDTQGWSAKQIDAMKSEIASLRVSEPRLGLFADSNTTAQTQTQGKWAQFVDTTGHKLANRSKLLDGISHLVGGNSSMLGLVTQSISQTMRDLSNVMIGAPQQRFGSSLSLSFDAIGMAPIGKLVAIPLKYVGVKAIGFFGRMATKEVAAGVRAAKGIGSNPFKGKTFEEIDQILTERGFRKVGPDPVSSKGSYFHPETGRKYYLDKGGVYKEGVELPHVDVHRMNDGVNLESVGKRRYPLGESLIQEKVNTRGMNVNF